MEIKIIENAKLKCEIFGCKNLAQLQIDNGFSKKHALNICKSCASEISNCLLKELTPKSIKNIYNNVGAKNEKK